MDLVGGLALGLVKSVREECRWLNAEMRKKRQRKKKRVK